jgi:hypothetical protein
VAVRVSGAAAGPPPPPGLATVRAYLNDLQGAPPHSMDGYSREKFPHWIDQGNSCDTRETVLKRDDLEDPQLIAVSGSSNEDKSDQDPSQWKPSNRSDWCAYAEDWIDVKHVWGLTVTSSEKSALSSMLGSC